MSSALEKARTRRAIRRFDLAARKLDALVLLQVKTQTPQGAVFATTRSRNRLAISTCPSATSRAAFSTTCCTAVMNCRQRPPCPSCRPPCRLSAATGQEQGFSPVAPRAQSALLPTATCPRLRSAASAVNPICQNVDESGCRTHQPFDISVRSMRTRATPRCGWPTGGIQVSIFEETGGGLGAVAHDRSLELFFDRFEVIARFVALINEDPAPRRVLYLHGLGGNGKSLLLRYLAARCCVRLPPGEWERVRRLPGAELPAALAGAAKARRCQWRGSTLARVRSGRTGRRSVSRRCSCSSSS